MLSERSSIVFNAQTGSLKKESLNGDADKNNGIQGMSESLRRTREGVTKSEDLET